MRRTLFIVVALSLCAFFTSCYQDASLEHVPATADVVCVMNFSDIAGEKVDQNQLVDVIDDLPVEKELSRFLKKIIADPQSSGLDLLKYVSLYADIDDDGHDATFGIIAPVHNKADLQENIMSLKKDFFDFKTTTTMQDYTYVYPFEDEKDIILGWNDEFFVILLTTKDKISTSALAQVLGMEEANSILNNDDFCKFKKDIATASMWAKSDVFGNIAANEMSEIEDFLDDAGLETDGNYFHAHIKYTKEEYSVEMKFRPNESIQNHDYGKISKALKKLYEDYYHAEEQYPDDIVWEDEYDVYAEDFEFALEEDEDW
ncbi:MAG: DUF4836 family protein [Bacteroidales bacterium]|nr:DUF4836 family protein [Bacteroidales bacterium]